jgi:hypothetical protein
MSLIIALISSDWQVRIMREDRPRNLKDMLTEAEEHLGTHGGSWPYCRPLLQLGGYLEEVFGSKNGSTASSSTCAPWRYSPLAAPPTPSRWPASAGGTGHREDRQCRLRHRQDSVKKLGIPPSSSKTSPRPRRPPYRVRIESESALDGRSLEELDLPVETGMRPIAVRSGLDWNFDPDPEDVLREGDVLFLQGPPEGVAEGPSARRSAGCRRGAFCREHRCQPQG